MTRDFGSAFNNSHISDRVLHVEIISEEFLDSKSDYEVRDHCNKNLRENEKGDETQSSDLDLEFPAPAKVITLPICSLILAEKSPFFYNLFTNGMWDSQQRHLTMRINPYEEAALMDLMQFIYSNTLSATTAPDLLDVLMIADKFEVISCMRYCSDLLVKLPMPLESAFSYLELPSCLLMAEAVQPIVDAAKQCIAARYKNFIKCEDEVMELPLSVLEIVLSSDGVEVSTEDSFFGLILKWARAHYPNLEERREILSQRLVQFINFPYMSCSKLKEVLLCPDFDHERVSKLVIEALLFKAEVPYGQHIHPTNHLETTKCGRARHIYQRRLIKVVQFELPQPHCFVYFTLKKEECETLFKSKQIASEHFYLGGKRFYLVAQCFPLGSGPEQHHFGLFVKLDEPLETCRVDFVCAVMDKSSTFRNKLKADDIPLTGDRGKGFVDLFGVSWTDFISDDHEHFINGCVHLRAELVIKSPQN